MPEEVKSVNTEAFRYWGTTFDKFLIGGQLLVNAANELDALRLENQQLKQKPDFTDAEIITMLSSLTNQITQSGKEKRALEQRVKELEEELAFEQKRFDSNYVLTNGHLQQIIDLKAENERLREQVDSLIASKGNAADLISAFTDHEKVTKRGFKDVVAENTTLQSQLTATQEQVRVYGKALSEIEHFQYQHGFYSEAVKDMREIASAALIAALKEEHGKD
jgi:chromosome segregation ATPase